MPQRWKWSTRSAKQYEYYEHMVVGTPPWRQCSRRNGRAVRHRRHAEGGAGADRAARGLRSCRRNRHHSAHAGSQRPRPNHPTGRRHDSCVGAAASEPPTTPRASKRPVSQQQKNARLVGGGVCRLRSVTTNSPSISTWVMPGKSPWAMASLRVVPGRSGDRAAHHDVGRPANLEQANVDAMGACGIAGRHRHRLAGGEIAHRREVKDVTKHAARNDTGAAGRIGAEREAMELILSRSGARPGARSSDSCPTNRPPERRRYCRPRRRYPRRSSGSGRR